MLFCFEAASRAAVAHERAGGVVQGRLHDRVVLLVFQLLVREPLGRGDERRFALQVLQVPLARCGGIFFQCDDGFQHVERMRAIVGAAQDFQRLAAAVRRDGGIDQAQRHERDGGRRRLRVASERFESSL